MWHSQITHSLVHQLGAHVYSIDPLAVSDPTMFATLFQEVCLSYQTVTKPNTETRPCLRDRGMSSNSLEMQVFSHERGLSGHGPPTEIDSHHGHLPHRMLGSVVPQSHMKTQC